MKERLLILHLQTQTSCVSVRSVYYFLEEEELNSSSPLKKDYQWNLNSYRTRCLLVQGHGGGKIWLLVKCQYPLFKTRIIVLQFGECTQLVGHCFAASGDIGVGHDEIVVDFDASWRKDSNVIEGHDSEEGRERRKRGRGKMALSTATKFQTNIFQSPPFQTRPTKSFG